jgi:very-short-patch-repair endonuclease
MSSFQSRAVARRRCTISAYAQANRRHANWPEQILWNAIRGGALGVTFRRQVPIAGRYIADFYAAEVRLVVEVDGPIHGLKVAADGRRDAWFERNGYVIVRVPAELVLVKLAEATALIGAAVARLRVA